MDVTACGARSGVTGSSTFGRERACAQADADSPRCIGNNTFIRISRSASIRAVANTDRHNHTQHHNTGKNGCSSELGAAANTRAIHAAFHLGGGSTFE